METEQKQSVVQTAGLGQTDRHIAGKRERRTWGKESTIKYITVVMFDVSKYQG